MAVSRWTTARGADSQVTSQASSAPSDGKLIELVKYSHCYSLKGTQLYENIINQ